ncbi:dicarboxylate/amino acid:cation symporter [[Bacillus] enclensis]|jgi:Na+/H+-dicarboxylate symporter|uniref:dicarboxylate/amino acid:cation symporter n=1 Tax=[Bacillus] enclensis TaxID=1402860 RepID=UPI0018DCE724|nr:dicarboxylate/amino acid:cation symporter [[Bacillus] enclensis]MBH9966237.1 dicarboxylate/amino acid:cation symporter [[Bacillus] enclensis]
MKYIWEQYMKVPFVLKMSAGFLLGIAAGLIFKADAEVLKPFGTVLIHLLSLIAIPVIFLTVVQAVNKMSVTQLGRMGWKLILYYTATTAAAVFIGLGLAFWFNPGMNLSLPDAQVEEPKTPHFSDVLLQIIPDNLFQAFAGGDTLAIMFLAVIMGIAISWMKFSADKSMKEYGNLLDKVFAAFNEMFYILLKGVLVYAPFGVFAISAATFGQQGWETIRSLAGFVGVFYLGIILLWILVYAGFLKWSGQPVLSFFKRTKEAYSTAFFTSSSIASLPVAIQSAKKAGVSDKTANFALPLGAIFNSDGGALRMGVSIVFAANVTNLQLSVTDLLMIVLVGTLLSIGTSGVPAAGLVTLSAVLTMFGLPLEIVALIAGVDALIGMGGTASNVMGDIVGSAVVDEAGEEKVEPSVV